MQCLSLMISEIQPHARLCFLQCDWQMENPSQKVKAQGISQMSPDRFLSFGVRRCDYHGTTIYNFVITIKLMYILHPSNPQLHYTDSAFTKKLTLEAKNNNAQMECPMIKPTLPSSATSFVLSVSWRNDN